MLKALIKQILPESWTSTLSRVYRERLSLEFTFSKIFAKNGFGGVESVSGEGSSMLQTNVVREVLPKLVEEYKVNTFLDVPCGDLNWMQRVEFHADCRYIGGDIVPALIESNQEKFGSERRSFQQINLASTSLPKADMLFCRDCLVHLSFDYIHQVLANVKRSDIVYLVTTTFPNITINEDIVSGEWRCLNLSLPPFNFPEPLALILEECPEAGFEEKCLGIWKISEIKR